MGYKEKFHYSKGKHKDGYAILKCTIECKDDEYLDLYDPEALEYFHMMRYTLLEKSINVDPQYKYHSSEVADTQVFDVIRSIRNLSVIRCPQFFGMFEIEKKFIFETGYQFPKTYVPNVIIACVDSDKALINNIEIIEERRYDYGYEVIV